LPTWGDMRITHKIFAGKPKGKDHLRDEVVAARIIAKLISRKFNMRCRQFIWFRIVSNKQF